MPLILLAEPSPRTGNMLTKTLGSSGWDVVPARNARNAIVRAAQAQPDLILLDIDTPVMDGLEVLKKLKDNAVTKAIPVITMTITPNNRAESNALKLGAVSHLSKDPGTIVPKVRSLLRELEDSEAAKADSEVAKAVGFFKTGDPLLDERMDGGIRRSSLAVLEGPTLAVTEVFSQRLAHQSLSDGHDVTYVTTERSESDLLDRFESSGRDVAHYRRIGKLDIHRFERATPTGYDDLCGINPDRCEHPERMLLLLGVEIEQVSKPDGVTIVDTITDLANQSRDYVIARFFAFCKSLCDKEKRTIVLSSSFSPYTQPDERKGVRVLNMGKGEESTLSPRKAASYEVGRGCNATSFI